MAQRTRTKITEVAGVGGTDATLEVHRQNKEERIRRSGPGVESIRRVYAERLRIQFDGFCEHGAFADLVVFSAVLEDYESHVAAAENAQDRAFLLESLLRVLSVPSERLLSD